MKQEYLDLIYKLATQSISPYYFDNPNKYLFWFFENIRPILSENEKFLFTNIQLFDFKTSNNEYFHEGRLFGFPTLYGTSEPEKLTRIKLEVITFLIAVSIMQKTNFEGVRSSISAFKDRMIIETISKDVRDNFSLGYDDKNKVISLNLPDFYDEEISEKFRKAIENLLIIPEKNISDSSLIMSDEDINNSIAFLFNSGIAHSITPEIQSFLNSEKVQRTSQIMFNKMVKLNKKFGFAQDDNTLKNYIYTVLLHSWIKSCKYNYMITSARRDETQEPTCFVVFLTVSNSKLSNEKLNFFQIILNIANNVITEILNWNRKKNRSFKEPLQSEKLKKFQLTHKSLDSALIYKSSVMQKIDYEITKLARTNEHVLLLGETGVGKDLIASEIHKRSSRADKPFVTLPLNNLSESLIESELFGYAKGSFTGAIDDRSGRFEFANGGTIYLPEISELPERIQLKLLEFLQFSHIDKIGNKGNKIKIDARLIFASNANLEEKLISGNLRQDFYYRISVLNLRIPPLRERKEDISVLAEHFIKKHSLRLIGEEINFDTSILELLEEQDWNGNVRQLEHLIIYAIVKSDEIFLTKDLFMHLLNEQNGYKQNNLSNIFDGDFKSSETEFKRSYFINLLKRTNGNVSKAADIAKISRQALYKICKDLNIKI